MDPWEALDVDDSDLPSLLRPCKRRHENNHNISTISQFQPNLTASYFPSKSQPSQTLDCSHLSQSHPSQTLDSHSQQFDSAPPTTASLPLIPGPAGAVQAAMLRKAHDNQNNSCHESPIPTQEYIRRAVEDVEEDHDFKRDPWLFAIEFISCDGMLDCVIPSAPLSSIKKCLNNGKVDQVVAVIKSCTPNGLGDLMVTLKDPTGTAAGTIHHKVLAEGEFAKDISVGSVLILQKVAVFAPSRSAYYLNIMLSNVVKVFRKDGATPLKQNYHACAVKYPAPGSERGGETRMSQKGFSLDQGGIEGVMNEIGTSGNARGRLHSENQPEKGNPFPSSVGHCSNRSSINIYKNAAKEAVWIEITEDERGASGANNDKWPNGNNLSGNLKHTNLSPNLVENHNEKGIRTTDTVQKQKGPLITSASLPQWTDEQLNELFAGDCADDGDLF